jgi:flagellar basal-body rod protein FlgF
MQLPSYVALSFMSAQSRALDVTAANLANAGTAGFKAERVLFSDYLGRQTGTDGALGRAPVAFVQDRATYREQAPGSMTPTGNPLDLAISGEGFFTVATPRGPRLSRAGRFAPQADGTIADGEGNALLDATGQKLRVSAADTGLTVTADGVISSENGRLGRIGIVEPSDPMRMTAEGSTTLRADVATDPVARPRVVQGMLEDSNVQPIREMTRMMSGLRSFQFAAQFVEQEGQRVQSAIDKITARRS